MSNFTVISDAEAVELRKLREFYKDVSEITINHDNISNVAVVYPNKLSSALEKVDVQWYINAFK